MTCGTRVTGFTIQTNSVGEDPTSWLVALRALANVMRGGLIGCMAGLAIRGVFG